MSVEERIRDRAKSELSSRRFGHTVGVVKTAQRLAVIHGIDPERARIAAWVHDIAKEWGTEDLVQAAEKIEVPAGFGEIPSLLHGPVAAALLKQWFDVNDDEIANAVRYHTTGRMNMSPMEKVIYLADAIEPGRSYPGVDRIRALAETDLTQALAESIDNTLRDLLDRHKPIFPLTIMVRNYLWDELTQRDRPTCASGAPAGPV